MLKERRGRSRGGGSGGGRGNQGRGIGNSYQGGDGCTYPRGVGSRKGSSGSSKYRGRGIVNSNLQRRGGRSRGVGRNKFIDSRHASPR